MDYSGKIITKNAVTPTQSAASGVWTLDDAMQAQKANNWPISGVPNPISKSLRFNSADSAYLNRTPSVAGNQKTWTWSAWVKRSGFSTYQTLFTAANTANVSETFIYFIGGNVRLFQSTGDGGGSAVWFVTTLSELRDPSAWYHIVVSVDTTQSTSTNRVKLYVNNLDVSNTANTYPAQNYETTVNTTQSHRIGIRPNTIQGFEGYITELNFVDGQQLTPSDFGMTDPNTGAWIPKRYAGTYGTNGFYVNFKDATNTSTLGLDYSGNGNNWSANNFSVTAGINNDSLTDVPTQWIGYNTSGDVGGVVRGNYPTINSINMSANMTSSDGNLKGLASAAVNGWPIAHCTMAFPNTGKWYWEYTAYPNGTANDGFAQMIGIVPSTAVPTQDVYVGNTGNGYGLWIPDGSGSSAAAKRYNSSNTTLGSNFALVNGDVFQIAFDAASGKIWFGKNNTWYEGNPSTNTTPSYSSISTSTAWVPIIQVWRSGNYTNNYAYLNFGQRPFAYTPPAGFVSLCTTNLPTPTIGATSTTQAGKYFNTVLYTGTGSSLSVTGVGFQPDFVWIKGRSGATDHGLYDAVRGVQKQLKSNTTDSETTETTGLTAFGTDGFTVGALAQLNTNTATYVGWNWNGGGSNATNTSGSITSTVRANTTAGFSIVTYTGTGANATVGHGLGVAPQMIIIKNRTGSGVSSGWGVYHVGIGATKYLALEQTAAAGTSSALWNNTAPTSTVFSLGNEQWVNTNGGSQVAYCFAPVEGYSAFGSYTGNGSSSGPFVYLGFRPRYLLIKRSDSAADWAVFDTTRSTYNGMRSVLQPNNATAEGTFTASEAPDSLSNGFRINFNYAGYNANGGTYIYAAFAEFPFKFSNAR